MINAKVYKKKSFDLIKNENIPQIERILLFSY